ncbi:hypothetical protein CTI14_56210, partial [Methylobacterium radiotolerans]
AALRSLSGLLDQIEAGTDAADKRLSALDHGALMDEVRSGVQQVETALTAVSLADDVLIPASGVSVAALAPSGGKMDVGGSSIAFGAARSDRGGDRCCGQALVGARPRCPD